MPKEQSPNWGPMAAMGFETAVGVGLGYFVGHWLDSRMVGDPWGTLTGVMIGLTAGMYLLIREAIRSGRQSVEQGLMRREAVIWIAAGYLGLVAMAASAGIAHRRRGNIMGGKCRLAGGISLMSAVLALLPILLVRAEECAGGDVSGGIWRVGAASFVVARDGWACLCDAAGCGPAIIPLLLLGLIGFALALLTGGAISFFRQSASKWKCGPCTSQWDVSNVVFDRKGN